MTYDDYARVKAHIEVLRSIDEGRVQLAQEPKHTLTISSMEKILAAFDWAYEFRRMLASVLGRFEDEYKKLAPAETRYDPGDQPIDADLLAACTAPFRAAGRGAQDSIDHAKQVIETARYVAFKQRRS